MFQSPEKGEIGRLLEKENKDMGEELINNSSLSCLNEQLMKEEYSGIIQVEFCEIENEEENKEWEYLIF